MEGLAHVAARAANRLSASLDVLSVVVCVASYAGVAGLATNTEDDAHGVPVDAIETAARDASGKVLADSVRSRVQLVRCTVVGRVQAHCPAAYPPIPPHPRCLPPHRGRPRADRRLPQPRRVARPAQGGVPRRRGA